MAESNLFNDIQECLDAMAQAVDQCADEDCTVGQMWTEIDAGCQRLAALSAGDLGDEEDEESEDVALDGELNFDEEEQEGSDNADKDEDDEALQ